MYLLKRYISLPVFISYCWYNKWAQIHFLIRPEKSSVDLAVRTWRCPRGCVPSGGSGGVHSRGRRTARLWAQLPLQPRCGSCPHVSFTSCDSPDSLSDFWGPLGLHCTLNSNPEGLLSLTTSTQVPFAMWVNSHRFWGFGPGRLLGEGKCWSHYSFCTTWEKITLNNCEVPSQ